jgi:glycerophosphoryl diester phosphodiesterase
MLSLPSAPLIFAHRGASSQAPENTLASFQRAIDAGAPAIEYDVKLSRDGAVVVIHDQTVDRTTDGHGKVRALSLSQLRALDAGSWFDSVFCGERLPTLDEVLGRFGGQTFMDIELTNYASPFDQLVPKVALLIKKHRLQSSTLLSSFLPHNLAIARRVVPEVPRGLLAFAGWRGDWQRLIGRYMDLQAEHPFLEDATGRYVAAIHARGRKAYVYTVNDRAGMRRLFEMGVDGLFTDDPALALTVASAG